MFSGPFVSDAGSIPDGDGRAGVYRGETRTSLTLDAAIVYARMVMWMVGPRTSGSAVRSPMLVASMRILHADFLINVLYCSPSSPVIDISEFYRCSSRGTLRWFGNDCKKVAEAYTSDQAFWR